MEFSIEFRHGIMGIAPLKMVELLFLLTPAVSWAHVSLENAFTIRKFKSTVFNRYKREEYANHTVLAKFWFE